jgi:3-polyprenyl-4-hydroxybenzoate decarboxylase
VLIRSPLAKVAEREGSLVVVGGDQRTLHLTGDSAELARAILDFLNLPRSRIELSAHLETLSGGPLEHPEVIDELLSRLFAAGALRDAPPARADESPGTGEPRTRLVLGLSGAIGASHAPSVVGMLLEQGFDLEIVATKAALRMVSREVLEALTHRRVHASLRGRDPTIPAPHIHLAEWAEVMLVNPATATTLSRIARGDCSDIVSAVAISTRAPVLIVPSMNGAMYEAPAVQRNLELLRQDGFWNVYPATGIEVAHAPSDRLPVWGAAPPPHSVLQILRAVLALPKDGSRPNQSRE